MPTIPAGAKKPADRMRAEAKSLDNADEFTVHEFKGHNYRVLPFMDWDKTAMAAVNNLDFNAWARGAMHPDDIPRFVTSPGKMRETIAFVKDVTADMGIDVGELFASTD